MRKLWTLAIAASLVGCSFGADIPAAQNAVTTFHQQQNAGKFTEIYAGSAKGLRGSATEGNWVDLMNMVQRKLGKFQSTTQVGWNDQSGTSGHLIALNYHSRYERDEADEQFVYKMEDGKAYLYGYHVNSKALLAE